jgi:tRNA nucleotidyltransferase (CCA-adding enzyme)
MLSIFEKAKPVLEKIENAGFEAYFVGGSVRDFLLEKPIEDVDIATSATPDEIKKIFPKTVDVGIEHGTVVVIFNGSAYEVTTFRAEEEYVDFRRPAGVSFIRSLHEDLKRRDFTMNAIAMNKDGKLIDPFNGQKDIREKRIKTVGIAKERFSEDALRMMRAVRFVSQLSFTLEQSTKRALIENKHLLKEIAVERKAAEFEKLLNGVNRREAFQLIIEMELYNYLPGLEHRRHDLERLLKFPFDHLSALEMWALLMYSFGLKNGSIDEFLRKWKLPVKKIKTIQKIVHSLLARLESEWSNRQLYEATKEVIFHTEKVLNVITGDDASSAEKWLEVYDKLPIKHRSELQVTGNELMEWLDRKGGPWIKELFQQIEDAVLNRELLNQKEKIKEWVIKCNRN